SVGDIRALYTQLTTKHPPQNRPPSFTFIEKISANYIQNSTFGENSVNQIESLFNYRESNDLSQSAIAALHRTAAKERGLLPHALHQIPSTIIEKNLYYEQGHLEPGCRLSDNDYQKIYDEMAVKINNMDILPQWVLCEPTNTLQLQVFSAGMSYKY